MTRINLVDPSHLTDKHLLAEYRELPRIFTAIRKNPIRAVGCKKPERYVLGEGHVKFFYNKLGWLRNRYRKLKHELVTRGVNVDLGLYGVVDLGMGELIASMKSSRMNIEYHPSPEEIYLNMARLCRRSNVQCVLDEVKATN